MLGKLIKQELKGTSRFFIPMYIALGVMTLLVKLTAGFTFDSFGVYSSTSSVTMSLITGLLIMIYVFVIIGIFILTYFIVIRRFYTNMFGDEGYLMFTLPVTTGQLLNSKLIAAFIWQFAMIPAMCLSFFILFVNTDILHGIPHAFSMIFDELHVLQISGFQIGLLAFELLIALLVNMFAGILTFYLSITLGHHFFPRHRLLGSVFAYLGITTAESLLSSLVGIFTGKILTHSLFVITTSSDFLHCMHSIIPVAILCEIAFLVLYYALTHFMLNKKLNLD